MNRGIGFSIRIVTFIIVYSSVTFQNKGLTMAEDPSPPSSLSIRTDQNDFDSFLKVEDMNDKLLIDLMMNTDTNVDGSGESTTTETTVTTTRPSTSSMVLSTTTKPLTVLSQVSQLIVRLDCNNINSTITQILKNLKETAKFNYNISYDPIESLCGRTLSIDVHFNLTTESNNIAILNDVIYVFKQVTDHLNLTLLVVNRCDDGQEEPIAVETEISSCYLITLCALCGKNPPRGVCLPEKNLSRCECFVNTEDLSHPYVGDFCLPEKIETTNFSSTSSNWSIIVIAILTGCVVLFASILVFMLIMAYRRRRQRLSTENPTKPNESRSEENVDVSQTRPPSIHESLDTTLPPIVAPSSNRYGLNEEILISQFDDPIYELDDFFDRDFQDADAEEYQMREKNLNDAFLLSFSDD